MILTQQPVPKTIEDLAQEVSEDTLLARLENQRAVQVGTFSIETAWVHGDCCACVHACNCLWTCAGVTMNPM